MRTPLIAGLLSACALASAADVSDPLQGHRWKHRVLIAFADDERAPQARELSASLSAAACELEDRDMVIGWILSDGRSRVGDIAVSGEVAGVLRSGLAIQTGEFAVLLIGKDGGVKARYDLAPPLADVFALIDGMPMRRSEMRARGLPCVE